MENEKNQDLPEDLFADLLPSAQAEEEEIATDEQAVGSHPMADISDMEFEKIMQEALSEEWDLEDIAAEELIPDAQTEDFLDAVAHMTSDSWQLVPDGGSILNDLQQEMNELCKT